MPKITVLYSPDHFHREGIDAIFDALAVHVAKAADPSFGVGDIDFYPRSSEFYSRAPRLAIEIQTIGKPDRKKRMNAAVAEWKRLVEEIPEVKLLRLPAESPLIWIQYVDPDGPHV